MRKRIISQGEYELQYEANEDAMTLEDESETIPFEGQKEEDEDQVDLFSLGDMDIETTNTGNDDEDLMD